MVIITQAKAIEKKANESLEYLRKQINKNNA